MMPTYPPVYISDTMRCARCYARISRASEIFLHRKSVECKRHDPWYQVVEARNAKDPQLVEKRMLDILYPSKFRNNSASSHKTQAHKTQLKNKPKHHIR